MECVEANVNESIEMLDVAVSAGFVGDLRVHEPGDHGDPVPEDALCKAILNLWLLVVNH